ncbi:MAG: hypothetical protein JWP01_3132 [Myxococcales bacterium]|nr:hypothetical protein [Myxococcales bacterium]
MRGRSCPIPVVALVNLLFGIGFALLARERIRADGPFAAPAFHLVVLHAGAVVAPVALYFYAVHPAWSWMYWLDPRKLSGIAVLPLMVGHAGLVIGGWYVAALMLRRGHLNTVLYSGGAISLTLLVLVVSGSRRLSTAADYLGWQAKRGVSLFNVQLGWAFVVSLLALFGSAIYIAIELGRDGRRVRSR